MGRLPRTSARPGWVAAALGASALLPGSLGRAEPLPTNDYVIDAFQGPLLSPIRVTSLGGAYAGYAEDIPGMVANAAAPAVRGLEAQRHVELYATGSLSFPLDVFQNNDFDNSGALDSDYSDFVYVSGGSILQVGAFGAGLLGELQSYTLTDASGDATNVVLGRYHGLLAVSFARGQLAIGAGARGATLGIGTNRADLVYAGASPELGLLVRPTGVPFRFGATYRGLVRAHPTFDKPAPAEPGAPSRAGRLTLPEAVILPWELETGIAIQVGPRPLNVEFRDPEDDDDALEDLVAAARARRAAERRRLLASVHQPSDRERLLRDLDEDEERNSVLEHRALEEETARIAGRAEDRYAALPRPRMLLLLSILVSGPADRGVSLERFLAQDVDDVPDGPGIGGSGASVNFSPRFGIEVEPIARWLTLRSGSYYEPSRFGGVGRQHFTFGAQAKLFETDVWGLAPLYAWGAIAAVDLAPRYQSLSLSLAIYR